MMRLLTLLFVMWIASPAHANTGGMGVVVLGDPAMQPQVAAQLEDWLRRHGYQVVVAPLPPASIVTLDDCFAVQDEGCARKVVENNSKADVVVFARVGFKPDAPERTVALTAYWFAKGKDVTAERRFCERCTDQSLRAMADELIGALVAGNRGNSGRLELTSSPPGARVTLDGTPIGVTPLAYDLTPGNHVIALALERHEVSTREITVKPGETTQLAVPLAPTPTADTKPSRVLPLAVIGGGAVLVVTGGVLIAIDQDDSPMGPYRIRDTARTGVVSLAVGAVALGVGGYLWFRRSSRSSRSGPAASVNPSGDGGYIGWIGSF